MLSLMSSGWPIAFAWLGQLKEPPRPSDSKIPNPDSKPLAPSSNAPETPSSQPGIHSSMGWLCGCKFPDLEQPASCFGQRVGTWCSLTDSLTRSLARSCKLDPSRSRSPLSPSLLHGTLQPRRVEIHMRLTKSQATQSHTHTHT